MRVLVVDDEPAARLLAQAMVRAAGHDVDVASGGQEAVDLLGVGAYDVLVTDAQMPGMSGFQLAERVRRDLERYLYVIMLTSLHDDQERLVGMRAGVDDYLTKPLRPTTMAAQLIAAERVIGLHRTIEEQRRVLERQATQDGLTGVYNRLRLDADLATLVDRAQRYGQRFCLAMLDVDRFKAYNDSCGHLAGDVALRTVADVLRAQVRTVDSVYRFGGEEFLLLLPEQDLDGAFVAVDRIRAAVRAERLLHPGSDCEVITVSAGVAASDRCEPLTARGVVAAADAALFHAKANGRNRVMASGQGAPAPRVPA